MRAGYEPVDEESAGLVRNQRIKVGTITAIIVVIVVIGVVHSSRARGGGAIQNNESKDAIFSSLLMDDEGFFFPTTLESATRRKPSQRVRLLKKDKTIEDVPPSAPEVKQDAPPPENGADTTPKLPEASNQDDVPDDPGKKKQDATPSAPEAKPDVMPGASEAKPDGLPSVPEAKQEAMPTSTSEAKPDGVPSALEAKPDGVPSAPEATPDVVPNDGAETKQAISVPNGPEVPKNASSPSAPEATSVDPGAQISTVVKPKWSCDWKKNIGSCAAIGEYYRAKGMALADYYRSKYDPTYKGAAIAGPPTESVWTDDWQADKERGISLGEKYKAIGEAIDEHYRKAFDPTYAPDSSLRKGSKDSSSNYDWEADKERGLAIGQHYMDLGLDIAAHYNDDFDLSSPASDNSSDQLSMTDEQWKTFKKKGKEIGKYYHDKGVAIKDFYQGKFNVAIDAIDNTAGAATDVDGSSSSSSDEQTPSAENEDASELIDEMKLKGLAIADYYRAKYDPTYATEGNSDEDAATADDSSQSLTPPKQGWSPPPNQDWGPPSNQDWTPPSNEDFPSWGQDPEADKAHGKAIADFYKHKGKEIGHFYKEHGKELGKYYEDYYRTMFDPTYNANNKPNQ